MREIRAVTQDEGGKSQDWEEEKPAFFTARHTTEN